MGRDLETLACAVPANSPLCERLPDERIRCLACGHRCLILPGLEGICRVRFNRGGTLFVPRGYVAGLQIDPIEKKPFHHVQPGRSALSFGMLGCDLHCGYCHNWLTSQALRDRSARPPITPIEAAALVDIAELHDAPLVISTYNEPLITSEWAVEIFREAGERGYQCGYVSNGNATPEVLEYLRPHADLYKIDLKSFRKDSYRALGGTLDRVLETIRHVHELGFWLEVVTLLVPGFNDSREEIEQIAEFLMEVSPEIPWHVSAFRPEYRMKDPRATRPEDLLRAADIAKAIGLRFVYAGNLPGRVGNLEDTRCPGCGACLIERHGYRVVRNVLGEGGLCPSCRRKIPGRWGPSA